MTDSRSSKDIDVQDYLEKMLDVFAHISVGDFSKRIDVSRLPPDNNLTKILCGLQMMMDDLEEAHRDLAAIKDRLQQEVNERTGQLETANLRLNAEIKERKKIEEDLRVSEGLYRLLAESAHDFIYILDKEMRITYANSASLRFLGLTREELFGRPIKNLLPLSNIGLANVNLFEAIEAGIPLSYRKEVSFPKGSLWLDTVLVPLRDPNGRIASLMGISRDITEQMKSAEALAERERFLSDVFASIQDGISVLDKDLAIVRVNSRMEHWYAHALPLVGKKCYEVYHGRSEPCHVCPSIVAMRTGATARDIVPLHGAGGAVEGWLDLHAFPVLETATGKVKGVIEHVRDITERKTAEEKMRQSEERFRKLAETAGAGIFIVKNSKFSYVNAYMQRSTGYSHDELFGMNFWDLVHPEFQKNLQERYMARMRGQEVPSEYEFKYVKKDGSVGWVCHNVGLMEFDGGPALIGTLHEISESKKVEEALAAEKELLSVTMESIDDGVISVDAAGTILAINHNALALACNGTQDTLGKHVDDVMCFVDDTTKEPQSGVIRDMMQRHGMQHSERRVTIRTSRSGVRLADLSVSPIAAKDGSKIGMVLVFRDITEKQKMEAELFKARKLESLGVLAGGIAHDFNNILTGVITNLFMAKVKVKADADTYELLAEAEKASFRASKLVKQLLTFSKGGAPVKEAVSLKNVIEDAVGFCLSGSNVNYRLDIPADLRLVEADKGQIDQVLNNLVINADQSMPGGGTIVVSAENVTIESSKLPAEDPLGGLREGNYVRVSVADEGIGIPRENLEKIFDPYFTTKPNGNGLGLTIAYSIVKGHKGIITVDLEPGKGTVFSFYLPVAKSMAKRYASQRTVGSEEDVASRINVLVMDDDNSVRTVISQLLKNSGYSVFCTATGEETIAEYDRALKSGAPFDVVVMDLTIPGGMGGREAVGKLLELDPKARVVVSSGYSNDSILANFRAYGFCGVIAKPFDIDEFLKVIRKATDTAKQAGDSR
jgi:PAS domain S-box-containing protein